MMPARQMATRTFAGLLALSLALLAPATASSYAINFTQNTTGAVVKWPSSSVKYWLHPACSTDLSTANCLNGSRLSFQAWEGHSCSTLKFVDSGASSNKKLTSVGYNKND